MAAQKTSDPDTNGRPSTNGSDPSTDESEWARFEVLSRKLARVSKRELDEMRERELDRESKA